MNLHTEFLPPPTPTAATFPTARKVAIAGAVAALIGSFMAWVSVASIFGTIEISGFKAGDGKLTAAAAVAAILLGLAADNRSASIVAMLAAAGGLAVSVYDWNNLQHLVNGADSSAVQASVGNGLYLCMAGFVVCFFGLLQSMPQSDGDWKTALH